MSEGEGFLSRWSRRKRAAVGGEVAPAATPPEPPVPPEAEAAPAPPSPAPEPPFDPASLPPVESLTADSDFAAFLREGVPSALRQAALRRAWSLDPGIRDFVGPAEYAYDYNAPGGVPGFSLELVGDVKRLVAQAVGLASEPDEAPAADGDAAEAAAAAPAGAPRLALVEQAGDEVPPPAIDARFALVEQPGDEAPPPAVEARAGPPRPEAPPAPEPLPVSGPPSPPARRHGGALPS